MYLRQVVRSILIGETIRLPYQTGLQLYKISEGQYVVISGQTEEEIYCSTEDEVVEAVETILAKQI